MEELALKPVDTIPKNVSYYPIEQKQDQDIRTKSLIEVNIPMTFMEKINAGTTSISSSATTQTLIGDWMYFAVAGDLSNGVNSVPTRGRLYFYVNEKLIYALSLPSNYGAGVLCNLFLNTDQFYLPVGSVLKISLTIDGSRCALWPTWGIVGTPLLSG